ASGEPPPPPGGMTGPIPLSRYDPEPRAARALRSVSGGAVTASRLSRAVGRPSGRRGEGVEVGENESGPGCPGPLRPYRARSERRVGRRVHRVEGIGHEGVRRHGVGRKRRRSRLRDDRRGRGLLDDRLLDQLRLIFGRAGGEPDEAGESEGGNELLHGSLHFRFRFESRPGTPPGRSGTVATDMPYSGFGRACRKSAWLLDFRAFGWVAGEEWEGCSRPFTVQ